MSRIGLLGYGAALPVCLRKDVNDYYHQCVISTAELSQKITETMLRKGLFTRSPYIPTSERVTFIEKQSYMNGWLGKQRPLAGMEINDIFMCALTNVFSKVLLTGYAQVARSEDVRKYFKEGKQIASKNTEVLSSLFSKNDLSATETWDSEVTDSTVSPFSEKLMMFHSRVLSMGGIAGYGAAVSTSMRHDLIPIYGRLAIELGKYGDKGAEILIKHKWLEEPPLAADREKLIAMDGK